MIAAILLMLAAPVPAPAPAEDNPAASYIRDCIKVWGVIKPSAEERGQLDACLAEDFIQFSANGETRTKGQLLSRYGTGDDRQTGTSPIEVRFLTNGMAVAYGWVWVETKAGAKLWFSFMDSWLLRNGRWQAAASHSAPWQDPTGTKQ